MDFSIIAAVLCSIFAASGFWLTVQKLMDKKSASGIALQCLLRDRILQACKYYIEQGWADESARTNLAKMYDAYADLGGNDVAHDSYQRFRELPNRKPARSNNKD